MELENAAALEALSARKRGRSPFLDARWSAADSTLSLRFAPAGDDLAQALELALFLPPGDPLARFCYCASASAPAAHAQLAERAGARLLALGASASLLQLADAALDCVLEAPPEQLWPAVPPLAARAAVGQRLRADGCGADWAVWLLRCAAESRRAPTICQPMPASVHGSLPALRARLARLPDSLCQEGGAGGGDEEDLLAVAHWALCRAPTRLRQLEPEGGERWRLAVDAVESPVFQAGSATHGTLRAYHGTSLDNLHCILSTGLRNMSGTKGMKTGAAFGDGVYLAASRRVAEMFAPSWAGAPVRGAAGEDWALNAVLVCDVVAAPQNVLRDPKGDGTDAYFVVPDERHVVVRELLVFAHQRVRVRVPWVVVLSVAVVVVGLWAYWAFWSGGGGRRRGGG